MSYNDDDGKTGFFVFICVLIVLIIFIGGWNAGSRSQKEADKLEFRTKQKRVVDYEVNSVSHDTTWVYRQP